MENKFVCKFDIDQIAQSYQQVSYEYKKMPISSMQISKMIRYIDLIMEYTLP